VPNTTLDSLRRTSKIASTDLLYIVYVLCCALWQNMQGKCAQFFISFFKENLQGGVNRFTVNNLCSVLRLMAKHAREMCTVFTSFFKENLQGGVNRFTVNNLCSVLRRPMAVHARKISQYNIDISN